MGNNSSNQEDAVRSLWNRKAYPIVAAIDIGTTYSGWSFSFKDDFERCPTKVQRATWTAGKLLSEKAPTVILIEPDGKTIGAFGSDAETKYLELAANNNHKQWYYFQHFKMSLHKKGINRNMTLSDVNGRKLAAITVFGLSIRFMKDNLLERCTIQRVGIKETDIYWVLTVPAIWNDAAKQFMREAAVFGGIDEKDLIIGLEPECASIYCRNLPITIDDTRKQFPPSSKYLVVDAGGGTIDIVAHELREDGQLREIITPTGSEWGGNRVNEAFMEFMDILFGEDRMSHLKQNDSEGFLELLKAFELKKREFKDNSGVITIWLPELLSAATVSGEDEFVKNGEVVKKNEKLRIKLIVFKTFYQRCEQEMISDVSTLLANEEGIDLDYILLVGGFSDSKIIQTAMKSAFPDKVLIPDEAGLAVLKGAVMYGHRSSVIEQRVCRYTYGTDSTHKYDGSCSHPKGRRKKDCNGEMRCYDLFKIHVNAGDKVLAGQEKREIKGYPISNSQTEIVYGIYATLKKDPQLVTEDECEKIGEFTVAVKRRGRDKEFGVSMMFGGTEIKVKCVEKQTGKITKATVNFLG